MDPISQDAASWVEHVVWWQVYPLGFLDAEPESANPLGDSGYPVH